jgi:NADH-quinone oxidoreductase subunit E
MIDVKDKMALLGDIVSDAQKRRSILIHAFHNIQKEHNYLPEDELKALSKKLKIPLSAVYSTASFYKQFYFSPRGKKIVCVCLGTACHVRGASEIVKKFTEAFDVKPGETTDDLYMTLETVGCIGCCGLAPVLVVDDIYKGDLNMKKVAKLINELESERTVESVETTKE